MIVISARSLLNFTVDELWDIIEGPFILRFDDGDLLTNARDTLYSAYTWVFHKNYPNTPMLKRHHVREVLGGKRVSSDTHLKLLGNVMWDTYDYCSVGMSEDQKLMFRDTLSRDIYRTVNEMYNELTYRLEEYVVSLDILDLLEVTNHPKVKALSSLDEKTVRHVEDSYSAIREVLFDTCYLPNNMVSLASRSGLVKVNQLLQCVGPRGYLTDTNSYMFTTPVTRGYVHGLRSIYDSGVESRSASKSLTFAKEPLQQSEYFSRRLQLMSQTVVNLHYGDCGSTHYLHWHVRPRYVEAGNVITPGDLPCLVGKIYLTDKGTWEYIKESDTHLINKTIKIRSTLGHCQHPDPYGICSTCFGQLSESIAFGTNIGQITSTSFASEQSQLVMSTKHYDGSSSVEGILLDASSRLFLKVSKDNNSYLLADSLKGKRVKLVIPAEQAANITDVMDIEDVCDLNITRVSEVSLVGFYVDDKPLESVNVGIGRRLASMTYPVLKHVSVYGWNVDELGNYVIDLSTYDWSEPILTLPLRHSSMSDHSANVAKLLESSVEQMRARDHGVSPDAMLVEFFDLVNSRLSVNLAILEVTLYAAMVVSNEEGEYSLPKPHTKRALGVMKNTMAHRSLSASMAFENHREVLCKPESYLENNRPDHPFDYLLVPDQVSKYHPETFYIGNLL